MLDEFVHFLDEIGVASRWQALQGEGIKREMIDFFQYVLLYGMKTLFGIEAMNALPDLLFSDEAAMRLAGFNAVQIRQGICQRSHEKRQGTKPPGPLCQDTLADNIVKLSLTAMEAFLNGVIQDLATAGLEAISCGRLRGLVGTACGEFSQAKVEDLDEPVPRDH